LVNEYRLTTYYFLNNNHRYFAKGAAKDAQCPNKVEDQDASNKVSDLRTI